MKKKIVIISTTLIVLAALCLIGILIFKLVDYIKYNDFYDVAEKEFYIPDLLDGYVPQGFDYIEDEKLFIACGYMNDEDEASRVYVISEDGDEYYYTELRNTDISTPYTGHTGGIAYYREYVFITGSDGIDVFSLNDVLDENIKFAPKLATVDTSKYGVDPAYCFIYDDELYVGNYHKDGDYDTPVNQHYGDNRAVMLAFDLDEVYNNTKNSYYVAPNPCAVYSMPSYVQGVCVAEYDVNVSGTVVKKTSFILSTSYGMSTSNLYVHDFEKIVATTLPNSSSLKMVGVDNLPVYAVNATTLVETVEAPPMSEELVYMDGKIWIMNESASNKYVFGKFTTGNYLFSIQYPLPVED